MAARERSPGAAQPVTAPSPCPIGDCLSVTDGSTHEQAARPQRHADRRVHMHSERCDLSHATCTDAASGAFSAAVRATVGSAR